MPEPDPLTLWVADAARSRAIREPLMPTVRLRAVCRRDPTAA